MVLTRLFGPDASILRQRSLQLLFGANAMAVLGVAMMSPLLDALKDPFGVSDSEIGLLVTAIALPAIVLIPVGGMLTDRIGRKPLLVGGLLIFGGAGAAIGLTTSFHIALVLRFLQGVGMSATFPAIVSSIRDLYSDSEEATAQGLRVGISGTSQALFTTAAGFLVVIAWQYPFVLYALAMPVAGTLLLWFEEPLTPERRARNGRDVGGVRAYLRRLGDLIATRRVGMILVGHTVSFFALFTFLTYNSLIVGGATDGGAQAAGVLVGMFSLLYAGVATQIGRITSHFATRTKPLLLAHGLLGVGLGTFAIAGHVLVAGIGTVILALGMGIVAPMYRSLISGFGPPSVRGGLVSIGEGLGWVAVSVAPIAIGQTIDGLEGEIGSTPALQLGVLGVAVIAGAVGIVAVLVAGHAPRTEQERRTADW